MENDPDFVWDNHIIYLLGVIVSRNLDEKLYKELQGMLRLPESRGIANRSLQSWKELNP